MSFPTKASSYVGLNIHRRYSEIWKLEYNIEAEKSSFTY